MRSVIWSLEHAMHKYQVIKLRERKEDKSGCVFMGLRLNILDWEYWLGHAEVSQWPKDESPYCLRSNCITYRHNLMFAEDEIKF